MLPTNFNHQATSESKIKTDLMDKETLPQQRSEVTNKASSPSGHSSEKISGIETCRVCQCLESDKRGDAALEFLGIVIPVAPARSNDDDKKLGDKSITKGSETDLSLKINVKKPRLVELVSPDGEILVCKGDLETGLEDYEVTLIELGCSCKNDLALVHYACALKWFVNHGSIVCEICGNEAKNIRNVDFKKVISSLKEYESLRERTDAVAAIRRQRLSEISLWFGPHYNRSTNSNNGEVSEVVSESSLNVATEDVRNGENPATKWAVEATGILLATGLLTITLAWLLAPRVGKKTARSGLHILLGGICALTVVVFFRFFVLTRIKYGPARYWAILFVFWFLVFGIWASRTHAAHTT